MSSLTLTLTKDFDAEIMRTELSKHLNIDEPKVLHMRAADPPAVLQLLGDALSWSPLKVTATTVVTVYLSTLAKRAANDTWDGLKSLLKSKEAKPLTDVAKTLEIAANSVTGERRIAVGLSIPDDYFGTMLCIRPSASEEIARQLAFFVVHAEQISKSMQAEIAAGYTPLGGATIELHDDGSLLVSWVRQADSSRHELKIPAPDRP